MTESRKQARARLREVPQISTLLSILDDCAITETDRNIIIMHYVNGYNFDFIADSLGYSVSAIKKKHKRILDKISKII